MRGEDFGPGEKHGLADVVGCDTDGVACGRWALAHRAEVDIAVTVDRLHPKQCVHAALSVVAKLDEVAGNTLVADLAALPGTHGGDGTPLPGPPRGTGWRHAGAAGPRALGFTRHMSDCQFRYRRVVRCRRGGSALAGGATDP